MLLPEKGNSKSINSVHEFVWVCVSVFMCVCVCVWMSETESLPQTGGSCSAMIWILNHAFYQTLSLFPCTAGCSANPHIHMHMIISVLVCVCRLAAFMMALHRLGGGGHRGEQQLLLWLSILHFTPPQAHIKELGAGPPKLAQVQNTQHRPLNTGLVTAFELRETLWGDVMPEYLQQLVENTVSCILDYTWTRHINAHGISHYLSGLHPLQAWLNSVRCEWVQSWYLHVHCKYVNLLKCVRYCSLSMQPFL